MPGRTAISHLQQAPTAAMLVRKANKKAGQWCRPLGGILLADDRLPAVDGNEESVLTSSLGSCLNTRQS